MEEKQQGAKTNDRGKNNEHLSSHSTKHHYADFVDKEPYMGKCEGNLKGKIY